MRGSPVVAGDPAVSRPLMVPIWFYVASGASQAREARRRLTAACVRRADRPRAYVEPCSITACSRTSPGMIASRVIGRSRLRRSQSTHTPGLPAVTCPLGESGRLTRWSSCPDSDKRSVAVGIVGFGPVGGSLLKNAVVARLAWLCGPALLWVWAKAEAASGGRLGPVGAGGSARKRRRAARSVPSQSTSRARGRWSAPLGARWLSSGWLVFWVGFVGHECDRVVDGDGDLLVAEGLQACQ